MTLWTAACMSSLPITNSQSLIKLMSIMSVMPSNHLILVPFSSCLQSFPASGSFPMSQFFTSGGQSIGVSASASALPMNVQDWVSSPPPEDLPNPGIKPISCLLLTNYSTQIKDDDKSCYSTPMKTLMPRPLSIQQHGKKHSRSTLLRSKID